MEIAFQANTCTLCFSIFSSGGHFVYRSETVLAILVEGYLSNIPMKFEWNCPRGVRESGV